MKSKFAFLGRRYLSLTMAVGFIFIYLLFTEIYDRYSNTWSLYQSTKEKESDVLDPTVLEHKRKILTTERDSLSSIILKERSAYQQNEVGVIQCVSDNARRNQVSIESIAPGSEHLSPKGQAMQFDGFNSNVSIKGRFNQIGLLINQLESETIPFDITKVEMLSTPIGTENLQVNMEAKAYLYHGIH